MAARQVFNPYLPSWEYVPDGEPHVFGDRLYLFGSHDRFGGADFCLNDYVSWSAPVSDLTDWRYEGVIYRKEQDPRNQELPGGTPANRPGYAALPEGERVPNDLLEGGLRPLFAPDVVCGPDGRYYLFYCLDRGPEPISVAVCDEPAGAYEFLGFVRHADGTVLGLAEGDALQQFDPGVFVDDDGSVWLYSGNSPREAAHDDGLHHSQVMQLCSDMLTLAEEPKPLLPSVSESAGTGFEGHEIFEASSIRKVGGTYYFVYSSVRSHELCYATSDRPDGGYRFGGTLVDIGDVFLSGRAEADALNPLGNTHGSIECVDGQWYVFYHRQTNRTNYSRQACAEKVYFAENGSIAQAEVTSCGLNPGPLVGSGVYGAYICCCLLGKDGATWSIPLAMDRGTGYPYVTQDRPDVDPEVEDVIGLDDPPVQHVARLGDGCVAGYKYFNFKDLADVGVELRGVGRGTVMVTTGLDGGELIASIPIEASAEWQWFRAPASVADGVHAAYFRFEGEGAVDFRRFAWEV